MNQRCTTHFHACDCREEIFKELENKLAVAITSLKKCQEYSSSYETLTGMGAAILIETRKALAKIKAPSDPVKKAIDDFCDKKGW